MASEDSQNRGWLPVVHRLSDLRDLDDAFHREMLPEIHQPDDPYELLEVFPLRSSQSVLLEERNDDIPEVSVPLDAVPEHVLAVVIVPGVSKDPPTSEEVDELFEDVATRRSLRDRELRPHLPSERHPVASVDGTAEAALAINESDDPSDGSESFLLVFRTSHVVTALPHEEPISWV